MPIVNRDDLVNVLTATRDEIREEQMWLADELRDVKEWLSHPEEMPGDHAKLRRRRQVIIDRLIVLAGHC